jgi:phospholipid/cholesterol/gamma-HCH transport system ATP-binding protein
MFHIQVRDLTMAYGERVIMRDVSFDVARGSVTAIVGGSGSGKSTLMRHMIGLLEPVKGEVIYNGVSFTRASAAERQRMVRRFGVTYQQGALWSSMTVAENVALPLEQYTDLSPAEIRRVVELKLALVGLSGFEDFYPSDLSGGMRKRAGLARALALDPEILFFDEPSAGLDPVTSKRLDDLILSVREALQATVILITHELPSLMAIVEQAVYLDAAEKTVTAIGAPQDLLHNPPNESVHRFFTRDSMAVGDK